jgi:small conductance mechanosensitive channel
MDYEQLFENMLNSVGDWAAENGLSILFIIAASWFLKQFANATIKRVVSAGMKRDHFTTKKDFDQRKDTLVSILRTTLGVLITAVAGMLILAELGIDLAPLLAGAGVAGIAIGFGAQSLVRDVVSGMFILIENQYRVGDVVELNGIGGTVEHISMRATVLRDLDGAQHHVPNGEITHTVNKTMEYSSVNMEVGVSYASDILKVEKVINKVGTELATDEAWQKDINETPQFVRIESFGDSSVNIKILGKVKPGKQWAVAGEMRKRLFIAFKKEKIDIPFPQLVVHK